MAYASNLNWLTLDFDADALENNKEEIAVELILLHESGVSESRGVDGPSLRCVSGIIQDPYNPSRHISPVLWEKDP